MTIDEKRELVRDYCGKKVLCESCVLIADDWKHNLGDISCPCLDILAADEDELDRALELISGTADVAEAIKKMGEAAAETVEKIKAAVKKTHLPESVIKDSGDRTEFTTGAVRDMHTGKGRMDLLPWAAIMEVSKHCENGALKYGEHNIDKGIPTSSLCDSAARHLAKHIDGWTDEPHLLAAAWNLLWCIQMEIKHPELVDVPWRDTITEK